VTEQDAVPTELTTAVVSTGHPAVDGALRGMANAAELPPDDQIAQYEATHRILAETLTTIDEG